jgi:hypothetical protein
VRSTGIQMIRVGRHWPEYGWLAPSAALLIQLESECPSQVSPVYASCAGDCSEWRSRGVHSVSGNQIRVGQALAGVSRIWEQRA